MMSGKIKIGKRKNAKHGQVKMNGKILSLFLYILLYAFCVVSGVLSAQEERYTYTVGSICQETITANKDLVDEYSTEILREEAMQKVHPFTGWMIPYSIKTRRASIMRFLKLSRCAKKRGKFTLHRILP